ncbi:MAG TPA: hypothetical protein VHM90_04340, partial [Phycisphaerae bacterium]|nr:hypothetical protein [Phycisphaerae bacterium]
WIALPLLPTICLATAATMWMYRGFLRAIAGGRRQRERLRRAGLYASGMLPPLMALLGAIAVLGILLDGDHAWLVGPVRGLCVATIIVLSLLALMVFYLPTMKLIWSAGRWRIARTALMFPIFPYVAVAMFAAVGTAVFWVTGYALVAIWSMLH